MPLTRERLSEDLRRHSGDVPAAACTLGIALIDHATVPARAKHAVAKIEAGAGPAYYTSTRRRWLEAQREPIVS